jgi:KEOPS complex subunit Cgi121
MRLLRGRVGEADALLEALRAVGEDHGVTVQAFDAGLVADDEQLRRAVALADRARERGEAIARDRAVEILLYAAGRRQIERALEMGVDDGGAAVVLVDDPDGEGTDPTDTEATAVAAVRALEGFDSDPVADGDAGPDEARLCDFFDVGERERAATDASLAELVVERVALLVVER